MPTRTRLRTLRSPAQTLPAWLLAVAALLAPCGAQALERDRAPARAVAAAAPSPDDGDADDAADADARRTARHAARVRRACAEQAASDQLLAGALRLLGGSRAQFDKVTFQGLRSLSEDQVWTLLGGRPAGPIDAQMAAGLLAQLQASELFSEVSIASGESGARLRQGGEAPAITAADAAARAAAAPASPGVTAPGVLALRLVEHPRVSRATVSGLHETSADDLLSRVFEVPSAWRLELDRDPGLGDDHDLRPSRRSRASRLSRRARDRDDDERVRCPSPLPDPLWLARVGVGGEGFQPGLAWKGLQAGVLRAVRWLRDEGYPLASARATLSAEGALAIEVDEGRVEAVEVRGLSPRLTAEVEQAIAFKPGTVFSAGELRRRLSALRDRFPFLERDPRGSGLGRGPASRSESAADGSLRITVDTGPAPALATEPAPEKKDRRWGRRVDWSWDDDDWSDVGERDPTVGEEGEFEWDDDWGPRVNFGKHRRRSLARTPFEVVGPGRLAVWLHARPTSLSTDGLQLIRHTPSTGFAPGLGATLQIWDPGDRVHVALDGAFAINTKRQSRDAAPDTDLFGRLGAQEKVDWLLGVRASVPLLRIAELGGQLYTLTDTADAWRIGDLDSYLYSALGGRADREYHRRSGVTALLTFHLFDQLTLGAEYRLDRYEALINPRVWSLFHSDDPAQPAAPVDPAKLGSFLLRLEWASDEVPLHQVGARTRHAETSLVERDDQPGPMLRTLETIEFGNPSLGGDAGHDFVKVVSDSHLLLDFGGRRLLGLRVRAGFGRDLPLQKQEALGGWTGLRGYDFKELRGDASLLATLSLRNRWLGGFLDVGAVHQPDGWQGPRLGAGGEFFFGRHTRFELAWRLDGKAQLAPSARLLFGWEL